MLVGNKKLKVKKAKGKNGESGVFIPSDDWSYMKHKLQSFQKSNLLAKSPKASKKSILKDVKDALQEVSLIRQGKVKPKSLKSFLSEL